jgi:hypothetical protein
VAVFLKTVLPGRDLLECAAAAALVGATYYGLAFLFCIEREHRSAILATVLRRNG